MKITSVRCKLLQSKVVVPFRIALNTPLFSESVLIEIQTDEGVNGYGEAAPFAPVTGSDARETMLAVETIGEALVGHDPRNLEQMHRMMDRLYVGQSAAKAGIDMALYDILGKAAGLPLYQLLGGNSNQIETDMTIGIAEPETMAQMAADYVEEGFRVLKIKAGLDPRQDLEAIRQIRAAVGADIDLRMDANQGWDVRGTIQIMKELEPYHISEIEQPVKYWDLEGCRRIRDHISQTLMLDESVHSPQDALRVVRSEAADCINIKLMKSAGIYPALKINAIAEAANIPCMVGCMNECRLGLAASAALVAAKGNIIYADLDGYKFIEAPPAIQGGFTQNGGVITLSDEPGLGVQVDFDAI